MEKGVASAATVELTDRSPDSEPLANARSRWYSTGQRRIEVPASEAVSRLHVAGGPPYWIPDTAWLLTNFLGANPQMVGRGATMLKVVV